MWQVQPPVVAENLPADEELCGPPGTLPNSFHQQDKVVEIWTAQSSYRTSFWWKPQPSADLVGLSSLCWSAEHSHRNLMLPDLIGFSKFVTHNVWVFFYSKFHFLNTRQQKQYLEIQNIYWASDYSFRVSVSLIFPAS